jgi:UV DNA damage endonuclease
MADFSSQQEGKRRGTHRATLDPEHFRRFLLESRPRDLDVMLEIKDKEKSAILALGIAANDPRLVRPSAGE